MPTAADLTVCRCKQHLTSSTHRKHPMTTDTEVKPAHTVAFETAERVAAYRRNYRMTILPRAGAKPQHSAVVPESSAYLERAPFEQTMRDWLAAIANERNSDVVIDDVRKLMMDCTDGALTTANGRGQAYTRHAYQQLYSLCGGKAATARLDDSNHARAIAFNDLMRNADRESVVLRVSRAVDSLLSMRRLDGTAPSFVRGVVSKRHSLEYFDDVYLCAALKGWLLGTGATSNATARVRRGVSETWGCIEFGGQTSGLPYWQGISWSNSEVGGSSLYFAGSLTVRALNDAVIEGRSSVLIDSVKGETRLRHVLPGGTSEYRAGVAKGRMQSAMREATKASLELAELWSKADSEMFLVSGFDPDPFKVDPARFEIDDVYIDAVEERVGFHTAAERQSFATVLKSGKALTNFKRGSVAHVVAAFALLGLRTRAGEILRTYGRK